MFSQRLLTHTSLFSLASLAASQSAIQFDGRVPAGTQLSAFDSDNGLFNPGNVFGKNVTFSKLLQLPDVAPSLFDVGTVPLEVTINDESIFAPSETNVQLGFRRAELLPASNNGTDPSTLGVKSLHFSLMKDAARPLNISHEYQLAFVESADFSTNQFVLKTGTMLDTSTQGGVDPDSLILFGNVKQSQQLFSTPFTEGVFHNFGLTLDFNANTTQVFYSTGNEPLAKVTEPLTNDISGQGQYHFGVLKKGVNGGADITKDAQQPAGINEGIIYGGIFQEDSSASTITLSPQGGAATNATAASSNGSSSCTKKRSVGSIAGRVKLN
ncbi:hypothetical protein KVR01_009338 [Diaporthe batatas]|uniref:uncharacterized protein n=1 Tax=Diaporthe batatas TaxID=748121 RepID=UPI001D04AAD1|nr:uncharacterized protein KVR01_009338 [Diaporthe batatas]KAG8161074.1 hypothetical protein KVR01_009338 [Diaporthe batatas]